MKHIVLSRTFDLPTFDEKASAGLCPRHTMSALRDAISAKVHEPNTVSISYLDRLHAKFPGIGTADTWAMTRILSNRLVEDDIVFTIGEDSGFPLAAQLPSIKKRPRLCVFVHHPERARVRLMFSLYRLTNRVDRFITNTEYKATVLKEKLGLEESRVFCISEQTDTNFFSPGGQTPGKKRPIIGSGGLEARDYGTLALATADLDVDVRICAVSPNAKSYTDTFPPSLPRNMEISQLDWLELRQLYRDSDVVVISLKDHSYQAGLTTLFEAMACKRPVVMTRTVGLVDDFAEQGLLSAVPPSDPVAMRAAITGLLDNPEAARMQAERGFEQVRKYHSSERYVADLVEQIAQC